MQSNLKFYSYKMMVAQELQERDYKTRVASGRDVLENVSANAVLITSDEAHFHLSGFVNKKMFAIGQKVA